MAASGRVALVSRSPGETRIALVEGGSVVEIHLFRDCRPVVGSIVPGLVIQHLPACQAVLVDIGAEDPGFLPVKGSPGRPPLPEGTRLPVQVVHEPRRGKGARLGLDVSIAGHGLILTPSRPGLTFSSSLRDPGQRELLQACLLPVLCAGEGLVVRPEACSMQPDALIRELDTLRARYQSVLAGGTDCPLPLSVALSGRHVEDVVCDDADLLLKMRSAGFTVRLWDGPGSLLSTMDCDAVLGGALARRVPLGAKGCLWIEPTAALTAIDVDSGGDNPDEVNVRAVAEIARQIRLRALAGMIVVDFIAPQRGGARPAKKALAQALEDALSMDCVPSTVLGVSGLGLVEIRRDRTRTPLGEIILSPAQGGEADILPETSALDSLRAALDVLRSTRAARVSLRVSPVLHALLTGRLAPALEEAGRKAGSPVGLEIVPSYPASRYEVA
ncbi:hypothetical protein HEQ62_04800 [Haematospirillum jordaniae]|uniref:RNA-binding protein AU-1/Ribonuclease E/G domain-containing protein n=1 Tax=Haematospirillum jordaniae TaxID=1549855 RepID=A0A143DDU5_9PROT|nr:ribonuclease E/G [Haematospirillum jordaniae]AMW34912.1 hypothetical protein AY555_06650 [Haematospirillum jordaniae]NKD45715.1 hypothetical protein [Haematospirillum jordaniae]NKD56749.1 hypothetical protein [Haematospirillum jordaniae]NKD59095.1 hypothetical protein [Haematospirillum jordaniae]NKD67862.1 hypothetical protein [Haematospirillum jordaniae]